MKRLEMLKTIFLRIRNKALFLFVFYFLFILSSYLLFPNFLGYDSYYFLDEVCGNGLLFSTASIFTVPPLANIVFKHLPCNIFFIKTLYVSLLMLSSVIIYYTVKIFYPKLAWRAIPFAFLFPIFLLNSLKIENDALAFPLIYLSIYFFFKYQQKKKTKDLILNIFTLLTALGFWGGAIYMIFYYSLFLEIYVPLALFFLLFFFNQIISPLLPNNLVDENNSFKFVRQTLQFWIFFILSKNFKSLKKEDWHLLLPLLIIGLLYPKLLILAIPILILKLIKIYDNAKIDYKKYFTPLSIFLSILLIAQVGLSFYGPTITEHEFAKKIVKIQKDNNATIENDFGLGHLIIYYGGKTSKHSGYSKITCSNCYVLTYFPKKLFDCTLIEEKDNLNLLYCKESSLPSSNPIP